MKKLLFSIICITLFTVVTTEAQETKTQELGAFTKLNLEGNIEMHLMKSTTNSIKIETNRAEDFEDFTIMVRNDELFLDYKKDKDNTPKFIVYLKYTSIAEVNMSGLISVFSEDALNSDELILKGSGIVKGEIEVAVESLKIDSDGITNLSISGTADNAVFNIDGLGKINAKKLETKSVQQTTDGFTKVKLGS